MSNTTNYFVASRKGWPPQHTFFNTMDKPSVERAWAKIQEHVKNGYRIAVYRAIGMDGPWRDVERVGVVPDYVPYSAEAA